MLRHGILPSAAVSYSRKGIARWHHAPRLPSLHTMSPLHSGNVTAGANGQSRVYRDMNGRFLTDINVRRQSNRVIGWYDACVWGFPLHLVIRHKNWVYSKFQKKLAMENIRAWQQLETTRYFFRGPRFYSQCPHDGSQTSLTPAPGSVTVSFGFSGASHVYCVVTCRQITHTLT